MNDTEDTVECAVHGRQGPAFVCQHLDLSRTTGFVEAYDPSEPDVELFQAWCSACDEVLLAQGEWNDISESFASPRLVCRGCYRQMKALNQAPPPVPPPSGETIPPTAAP